MSAIATYFSSKLCINLANKYNFYDLPDKRKIHVQPIPLLGGLALLLSIIPNALMFATSTTFGFQVGLMGAVFIFIIGLIDDKYTLNPLSKVVCQIGVISILFLNGIKVDYLTLPMISSPILFSPVQSFFMTQFWMLMIINMFNLIDGIDGLATGISFITASMLFFVSLSVSPLFVTFLLASIAGTTCSFLRFNFYPAKMFLGDSGALLLGYLFAYVSIIGVMKSTVSFMILIFVFAIPFMDLCLSVLRRLIKRQNIFSPDLLHIHHQLVRRGLSVPRAVLILYGICGLFGGVAIFISLKNIDPIRYTFGCLILLLVFGYFSYLQVSNKRFKFLKKQSD